MTCYSQVPNALLPTPNTLFPPDGHSTCLLARQPGPHRPPESDLVQLASTVGSPSDGHRSYFLPSGQGFSPEPSQAST